MFRKQIAHQNAFFLQFIDSYDVLGNAFEFTGPIELAAKIAESLASYEIKASRKRWLALSWH